MLHRNLSLFFILLLIFLAIPAQAAPLGPAEYEAGLDLKYSDNVIYTYNLITQTASSSGDFVFEPYLSVKFRKKDPLFSRKLSLYASSDIYSRYSPLNNQTYFLLFEQGLGVKTYLDLKYNLNPYLFVGEEEISASGQSGIDTSQYYRLQVVILSLDKDLDPTYNVYLFWKYILKDYNTPIAYRSAIAQALGLELSIRLDKMTTGVAGLSYETSEAEKGMRTLVYPPPAPPSTFNDDTSYTSPGVSFLVIRHVSSRDHFRVKYIYKPRHYTAVASEPLHGGREDQAHNFFLTNFFKLTPQMTWKQGLEILKRTSNKTYAEFTENMLTMGIDYTFK